jgi:hypothetical protein
MILITGCANVNPIIEAIEEVAVPKPQPKRYMPYPTEPNWDQLDLLISSSLVEYKRADLIFDSSITVKSQELPKGLDKWLLKIRRSGGAIYLCPSEQSESSELVSAILQALGNVAFGMWQDEIKYRPAEGVNAAIFVRQADLVEKNAALSRIEFVRRELELDTDNCKLSD